MDLGTIVTALTATLATALAAALVWRQATGKQVQAYELQVEVARGFEKQLFVKDRDHLAERNRIELEQADVVRAARIAAFEEGRLFGLAQRGTEHINELASQRSELTAKFETGRDQAVTEARDRLRAEYEMQTKLFTVMIRPYVSISEDKGMFKHDYKTVTGYQFQLLVNGIPAFDPHIMAEQTEIKKAINPEVERLLVQTAERAAEVAIATYLGGGSQFAKLAEPLIKRLPMSRK